MQTRAVVIHSLTAPERMPLVFDLSVKLGRAVEPFFAFDGSAWASDPTIQKKHPIGSGEVTQGNIGCTHSHLHLLRTSLMYQEGGIAIFEDDCVFTASQQEINAFCAAADAAGPWDLLLFGATEYVEAEPIAGTELCRPKRFWGTHALIVRPRAALAVISAFMEFQKEGTFPPADWLYSRAAKDLVTVAPKGARALCRQKEGLVSLITGKVR